MTEEQLTKEAKQSYISSGGTICPFCESKELTGYAITIEDGQATQTIICESCNKSWTDIYKLVDIEEEGE